jgi:hypothetical protein
MVRASLADTRGLVISTTELVVMFTGSELLTWPQGEASAKQERQYQRATRFQASSILLSRREPLGAA